MSGLSRDEMGVTCVVCCHNSAERLQPTLAHLAAQVVPSGVPWEVVVVDNASSDQTSEIARDIWEGPPDNLVIIREPRLGLTNARWAGVRQAGFTVVSFIDDDNWVSPDWVETAWTSLAAFPEVGACGGSSDSVCEAAPPSWFEPFSGWYAVGRQGPVGAGRSFVDYLWGAGLTVRKQALLDLVGRGFLSLLVDRSGSLLSSGGDTELCLALRLAGWQLLYEPGLRFTHYIPSFRLSWDHLRRRYRECGAAMTIIDAYTFGLLPGPWGLRSRLRETWRWQLAAASRALLWKVLTSAAAWPLAEGDPRGLEIEACLGRLRALLRDRSDYDRRIQRVRQANWNRLPIGAAV